MYVRDSGLRPSSVPHHIEAGWREEVHAGDERFGCIRVQAHARQSVKQRVENLGALQAGQMHPYAHTGGLSPVFSKMAISGHPG
jgi:hypothetical protein